MDLVSEVEETDSSAIPPDHRAAADRYIAAILERERPARLGAIFADLRHQSLWDQFVADYAVVTSGPFARHGSDAIRTALRRL